MKTTNLSRTGLQDAGLLVMRLMVGWVFLYHGGQKMFGWFGGSGIEGFAGFLESLSIPLPLLNAYAAAGTELLGGLALITGLGVRLVSFPLAATMLVAAFTVHGGKFGAQQGGMEYPLTLALISAGLGLVGPGAFALRLPKKSDAPSVAVAGAS